MEVDERSAGLVGTFVEPAVRVKQVRQNPLVTRMVLCDPQRQCTEMFDLIASNVSLS